MILSVIVPCYNEEENIRAFYEKAKEELQVFLPHGEIVFIDDGSTDGTWKEISALASQEKNIRGVRFSRNFGKEASLLAGLREAAGDYVAIIDADLQQNPKYIAEMLEILSEHPEYDCVAAYQEKRKEGKVLGFFKSLFYKIINRITNIEFHRAASDFRVMNRKMADAILSLPEKCRFSKGIFSWVGFSTYYMPYEVEERRAGKTKWNFWSLSSYAINGIVAFSDKPLIVSSVLGFFLFLVSIVMMLVVVIKTILFGDPVAGFPTLASLILLLSGIQLLCLGIVGQYLAKTYEEIKGRPVYVVKETAGGEKKENKK